MLEIKPFSREDLPDALRLCAQAGWNHVAADWERCLALCPEACLGGFADGRMQATCTLSAFGTLGWIGTFLVDEARRGQGCGKRLFAAMLETARGLGLECLGLDSSDAGRPIYSRHGFQATAQWIELWTGPAPADVAAAPDVRPLQAGDWAEVLAFDLARVHVPREAQLRALAGAAGATARVLRVDGRVLGFGLSRPGRLSGAIGPVVASDAAAAGRLVAALMADRRAVDGERPVGLAVGDHPGFKDRLAAQGLQPRRRNLRMFLPAPRDVLAGPEVFAATGLGMG